MRSIILIFVILITVVAYGGEIPAISPEFFMDNPIFGSPVRGETPAAAFDGTNYLVVWEDHRLNGADYRDIYGARVSKDGVIIDSAGFIINSMPYNKKNPAIAFDGTNYLVIWESSHDLENHIYGTRISVTGEVLDPDGFLVTSPADTYSLSPSIVFGAGSYFAVWSDDRNGNYDIYGKRISKTGEILDSEDIAICTEPEGQNVPVAAYNGSDYFVVWMDNRNNEYDIYGTRVSTEGEVLDSNNIAVSTALKGQDTPSVFSDGSNFFLAWTDNRNDNADIYGTLVSGTGTVLFPDGIQINSESGSQHGPAISFNGTDYMVIWKNNLDIYSTRVSTTGEVTSSTASAVALSVSIENPAIAFDGDNFLVVCQDDNGYIQGNFVTNKGSPFDNKDIKISISANSQIDPAIAFDGVNYFVVWSDYRSGSGAIYGSRVSKTGEILDISGIEISSCGSHPAIVFDGKDYIVLYDAVNGVRINTDGVLKDKINIGISGFFPIFPPVIAFDGENYLIAWIAIKDVTPHPSFRMYDYYLQSALIAKNGEILKQNTIYFDKNEGFENRTPAIAFDGVNYLIVWVEKNSGKIFGARVSKTNTLIDKPFPISTATEGRISSNAVIFDGMNYFVVWADTGKGSYDIYGIRVGKDGAILDTDDILISAAENDQTQPSVTFDGSNYVVIWEERKGAERDIHGSRVSMNGFTGTEFIVSANTNFEIVPAVASSGDGKSLVVYQYFDIRKEYNASRIAGRLFDADKDKPVPDEDVEITSDYDVSVTDSEDNEKEIDEDLLFDEGPEMDNDAISSEKKNSGCSFIIFAD